MGSTAQAEALDQRLITLVVLVLEIAEQCATLVHQHQQAAAAVMVLLVDLKVLGKLHNTAGKQGHLDFRRTGVIRAALVFFNDFLGVDRHDDLLDAGSAGTLADTTTHRLTRLGKPPCGGELLMLAKSIAVKLYANDALTLKLNPLKRRLANRRRVTVAAPFC